MLLNCFRRKDVDDPEQFLAATAAVLERYDAEVVDHVTALETGIAARQTFPPSISEVRQACEQQAQEQQRWQQRAKAEEQQLAERKAADAARQQRPTLEELQAKYGKELGTRDQARRARHLALIGEANARLLQRTGVTSANGIAVSNALVRSLAERNTP